MDLYAIIQKGKDQSSFWSPFETVYRICESEKAAIELLKKMAEMSAKIYSVPDIPGSYYSTPVLSDDGKTLSLFYHSTIVLGSYTNWNLTFEVVHVGKPSELFKESPF